MEEFNFSFSTGRIKDTERTPSRQTTIPTTRLHAPGKTHTASPCIASYLSPVIRKKITYALGNGRVGVKGPGYVRRDRGINPLTAVTCKTAGSRAHSEIFRVFDSCSASARLRLIPFSDSPRRVYWIAIWLWCRRIFFELPEKRIRDFFFLGGNASTVLVSSVWRLYG